ncbi:hypothetical protein CAEBREN_20018 [Caenorhabditis brenneri]|uniref:Uncharacterized protein n=1 Tax=Caenorhabditis brenneri TaxID=135651 RepID=G0P2Y1_CAEBE|nr:hypothetical protein CAEBREN_20018 [Caenorhabditis brenneri]
MGFKLVALSSWLLTVSALSIEHNAVGGGCIDLLCPDTASHHGLRNLVNEDTLKTDACTACSQCTENGYSVCLRPKDSRASRTAGGCSCSHTLAANCHTDLTQTQHPANLTMKLYTACYADALQRPPQPLAVNENSSVVVTIEPFWLEPYWRHLKVENVTLHYKFQVKAPEHCEGEVESTPNGVHTCVASVLVDLSESKEDQPQGAKDDDDDYDHSDNYDQYDDDLPPEVQFDRDVFSGAKELESYYTATIRRSRQIKASASKEHQIHDGETIIESEHLKFDLKPELYENGESESADESSNDAVPAATTEEESATVVQEDKDEGDVSDETGGTNFFEEEEKKEEETKKEEESEEEEDGVLKVNLEDIEPIKLKSQEDAKKKAEEDGDDEEKEDAETTSEKPDEKSGETEDKKDDEEKKEDEKEDDDEEKKKDEEEETTEEGTTVAGEDSEESNEDDSEETTTVELVEGETDPSQQNFWQRFVNSKDFPRVRNISAGCLFGFIICCLIGLCCLYGNKCCKSKESKTSNGYRYTSANPPPPTELVSREKEHLRQ